MKGRRNKAGRKKTKRKKKKGRKDEIRYKETHQGDAEASESCFVVSLLSYQGSLLISHVVN